MEFSILNLLLVVRGNALDEQVRAEAQAAEARTFIALTDNAEVNARAVQLARTVFLVPEALRALVLASTRRRFVEQPAAEPA